MVFVSAASFGILFFVVALLTSRMGVVGAGEVVLPIVLAVGVTLVYGTFQAGRRRWSFTSGVAFGVLALLAFSVAGAWGVISVNEAFPAVGTAWLHVVGTVVFGLLAAVVAVSGRTSGTRNSGVTEDVGDDDERWERTVAELLRERGDISDRRVAATLEEARASAGSATSMSDRFGSPAAFTRTVAGEPGVKARRVAVLYSFVAVWPSYLFLDAVLTSPPRWDGGTAISAIWILAAGGLAVGHWARFARERRDASAG